MSMRERQTIGVDVVRLVGDVANQCGKWLPEGRCSLAGEVLDVWRRGDQWEITLADTDRDDVAITARLPMSEQRPRVGYTIAILGQYRVDENGDDASFRLVFEGEQRNPSWVSRESSRRRKRRELIEGLLAKGPRADLLNDPVSVALVTSLGSNAVEDFKAGLEELANQVRCEHVPIPLESGSVDDIAAGIRHAGDLDVDLVVVARGGGKKIKLERFSHETVIEAVADVALHVPVVMAVGHERDRVDAEQVAWQRVATPGLAGTLVAREIRIRRARRRKAEAAATPVTVAAALPVHALDERPRASLSDPWRRPRQSRRWRRRSSSFQGLISLLILAGAVYVAFSWFRQMIEPSSRPARERAGLQLHPDDRPHARRGVRIGKPQIAPEPGTQPEPDGAGATH